LTIGAQMGRVMFYKTLDFLNDCVAIATLGTQCEPPFSVGQLLILHIKSIFRKYMQRVAACTFLY
jgi:hypothetical protein